MVTITKDPVLIIIRGLPGSGKSSIARELQKDLGADEVTLLDPDMTDYTGNEYKEFSARLVAEGVDTKLHPYRFLRAAAYAAIKERKIVIWNQGFTNLDILDRTIKNLKAYASEHGCDLQAIVVEVEIDHQIARERVKQRAAVGGHDVPDEAYERFINDYKSFDGYGYNIVTVNGKDEVAVSVGRIMPEVKKLRA